MTLFIVTVKRIATEVSVNHNYPLTMLIVKLF